MTLTTRAGKALTAVSFAAAVLVSALLTVGAAHASAAQIHPNGLPICDTPSPCPLDLLGGNQAPAPSDDSPAPAYGDPAEPAA